MNVGDIPIETARTNIIVSFRTLYRTGKDGWQYFESHVRLEDLPPDTQERIRAILAEEIKKAREPVGFPTEEERSPEPSATDIQFWTRHKTSLFS